MADEVGRAIRGEFTTTCHGRAPGLTGSTRETPFQDSSEGLAFPEFEQVGSDDQVDDSLRLRGSARRGPLPSPLVAV